MRRIVLALGAVGVLALSGSDSVRLPAMAREPTVGDTTRRARALARDGDLVFRRGHGILSNLVVLMDPNSCTPTSASSFGTRLTCW